MAKPTINEVLAANLRHYMDLSPYTTQTALGAKCGMAQRTIGNYLNPTLRLAGSKGKAPSANLAQLEKLADALSIEVWELLRPMTKADRVIYRKVEEAFREVRSLGHEADAPMSSPQQPLQVHEPRKRYRGATVYQFPLSSKRKSSEDPRA